MRTTIALLVAIAAFAAAAVLYFGFGETQPVGPVISRVAGVRLSYPSVYARDEATAAGGDVERVALIARFPGFAAVGPTPAQPAAREALRQATVLLTLTPRDEGLDPAERPSQLYAQFLKSDAEAGPDGLVVRKFESSSPYELEELYVAPPDGRSFFARCPRPDGEARETASDCLWLFRDGPLDVELRFTPAMLAHWRGLVEGARGFLAGMKTARPRVAPKPPAPRGR